MSRLRAFTRLRALSAQTNAWLLATGFWNDSGFWDDAAVWTD
jgi:hypothetical protein